MGLPDTEAMHPLAVAGLPHERLWRAQQRRQELRRPPLSGRPGRSGRRPRRWPCSVARRTPQPRNFGSAWPNSRMRVTILARLDPRERAKIGQEAAYHEATNEMARISRQLRADRAEVGPAVNIEAATNEVVDCLTSLENFDKLPAATQNRSPSSVGLSIGSFCTSGARSKRVVSVLERGLLQLFPLDSSLLFRPGYSGGIIGRLDMPTRVYPLEEPRRAIARNSLNCAFSSSVGGVIVQKSTPSTISRCAPKGGWGAVAYFFSSFSM